MFMIHIRGIKKQKQSVKKTARIIQFLINSLSVIVLMVFFVPQTFAVDGNLADFIEMYDINANGKIDAFMVEISNSIVPGTAVVNSTDGWLVTDGGNDVGIASVEIIGDPADNPQVFFIRLNESDPHLTVDTKNSDLEISYTQQGVGNGTDTNTGVLEISAILTGDVGNTIELDKAKPVPVTSTLYDEDGDGELDLLTVIWSENVGTVLNGNTYWTVTSAADFGVITEGVVNCGEAGSSASNECKYYFAPTNTKTNVGDLTIGYTENSVKDQVNNYAVSFTLTTTDFTDEAKPVSVSAELSDSSGDGRVDLITTTWSEPLVTVTNGKDDWLIKSLGGDYASLSEGNVVCNYGTVADNECAYNFLTSTLRTDLTSDLELDYSATNLTVKDSANNTALAVSFDDSSAPVALVDKALPVPTSARFYDDAVADGILDRIRVLWSEDINTTSTLAQWAVSGSDFAPLSGADADCGGNDGEPANACDIDISAGVVKTNIGNLQLVYNPGTIADLSAAANLATTHTFNASSTLPLSDAAKPFPTSAEVFDTNADGKLDLITTTWSEPLFSVADGRDKWALTSVNNYADIAEGAVFCNYGTAPSNECRYNFTTITKRTDLTADLILDYPAATSVTDPSGNFAEALSFSTATPTPLVDKAAPVILDFAYRDLVSARNGKIDQLEITFSEVLAAISTLAPNDLQFTSVGDFTGLAFGTGLADVTGVSTTALMTLGSEPNEIDTFSTLPIAVSSKNAFHLEDAAGNINTTLGAQTYATFSDEAYPIIKDFTYQDDDKDGKIDQMLVTFSEVVTGASILRPVDLSLTNDDDFNGAVFGPGADDLITANTSAVTVILGTESTVIDTKDSGSLAVSTQFNFRLDDVAGNSNTILEAQLPVTFTDGAAPAPVSATFEDSGTPDGLLDLVTIIWSEDITPPVADGSADWTMSGTDFGTFTEGAVTCGTAGPEAINECIYNFTPTNIKTDVGNLSLAYSGISITDGTNATGDFTLDSLSSPAFIDDAAPYPLSATFYDDAVADGILDRIRVLWSEDIQSPGALANWAATGANFAGMVETGVNCGGNAGEPLNACDIDLSTTTQKTDVGNLQLTYTVGAGNVVDLIGNVAGNQTFSSVSPIPFSDGAKPYPKSATFYDPDADGTLDLITVVWTEAINAVADGALDWAISSAANFPGLLPEGTVECNSGVAAVNECDYNFSTGTIKTDVGDLTLAYTGISVTDGTNNADTITFNAGSTPVLSDGAPPVFVSAVADSDTNINFTMSEPVTVVALGEVSGADWTATGFTASAVALDGSGGIDLTVSSLANTAYTASNFAYNNSLGNTPDIQDAAANSTFPFSGKTIRDGQAPRVTTGELIADESACTGNGGATCKIGDVITFRWDNSVSTGDGNTDISFVVADLTDFGGSATQPLYDTGTLGDTQIGDGKYSYAYTVLPGNDDDNETGTTFTVTATDTSAHTSLTVASTDTASVDNIAPIITTPGVLAFVPVTGDVDSDGVAEIDDTLNYTDGTTTPVDGATFSIDLGTLTGNSVSLSSANPHTVLPGLMNTTYSFTETATDNAGNQTTGYVNSIIVNNASGGAFTAATVTLGNLSASATTYADVSFNSNVSLPADGKIQVTFPSQLDVSGVVAPATNLSANLLADTLTIQVVGQTVTITRSGGALIPGGNVVSFRLSFIANPAAGGMTGNFGITTKTAANLNLSTISTIAGVAIIPPPAPPTPPPNTTVVGGGGGGGGGSYYLSVSKETESDDDSTKEERKRISDGTGDTCIVFYKPSVKVSQVFNDTFGHWARSYINTIAALGIVQGKTPTKYAPDDNISRAEILKIALNSFDYSTQEVLSDPLPDVDANAWYAPFVQSAFDNNIIYGFKNGLYPNTPASRGMVVTILAKAACFNEIDKHFAENYTSHPNYTYAALPDVPINAYYAPYVAFFYDKGIISGYNDGTFGPENPITRGEIAKIVVNILQKYGLAPE